MFYALQGQALPKLKLSMQITVGKWSVSRKPGVHLFLSIHNLLNHKKPIRISDDTNIALPLLQAKHLLQDQ